MGGSRAGETSAREVIRKGKILDWLNFIQIFSLIYLETRLTRMQLFAFRSQILVTSV